VEPILLVGVWLLAVTHLDTLLVIGAFCADNDYRLWEVLVGYYVIPLSFSNPGKLYGWSIDRRKADYLSEPNSCSRIEHGVQSR
jgi:hypothetical protein